MSIYSLCYNETHISDEEIKELVASAKKNMKESAMVEGKYQLDTVVSALVYLDEAQEKNQWDPPYKHLNICDNDIKKDLNCYEMKYSRRVKRLVDLGVLTVASGYYDRNRHICRKFDINTERRLELRKICEAKLMSKKPMSRIVGNTLYTMNWEKYEHALKTGCWFPLEDATEEELKPLEKYFAQIDNYNQSKQVENLEPFFISTKKEFTRAEKEYIKQYFFNTVVKNHKLYKACVELRDQLPDVDMSFTPHIKKTKTGYKVHATGRQNTALCQMKKMARAPLLQSEGFDLNWDWHSTIFTINRFLETGEYSPDWDLKNVIDYSAYNVSREQFKRLLFYIFFNDKERAYRTYKYYATMDILKSIHYNPATDKAKLPSLFDKLLIKERDFNSLYDECQKAVGGTEKHRTDIFIVESLFEMGVMVELKNRGIEVKNVFDCFYFKSTQTSIEEVKEITTEVLFKFAKQYALIDNNL